MLPHPGAAGARELAHRAPGAIIIGGGCECFGVWKFEPMRSRGGELVGRIPIAFVLQ